MASSFHMVSRRCRHAFPRQKWSSTYRSASRRARAQLVSSTSQGARFPDIISRDLLFTPFFISSVDFAAATPPAKRVYDTRWSSADQGRCCCRSRRTARHMAVAPLVKPANRENKARLLSTKLMPPSVPRARHADGLTMIPFHDGSFSTRKMSF